MLKQSFIGKCVTFFTVILCFYLRKYLKSNFFFFQCLPLSHQEELTGLVVGRLNDKAANVRRYAIQLLTALLQMNPFAHKVCVYVPTVLCQ